jgi:hypothetical protein
VRHLRVVEPLDEPLLPARTAQAAATAGAMFKFLRFPMIANTDKIAAWETLTDNVEFWQKTEYPLAAAAEIHLDVMKRQEKERKERAA